MPGTTVPNFALGGLSEPINALMSQLEPSDGKRPASTYPALVTRRIFTPIGAHKTVVDSSGAFTSNVDELYRFSLGLESARTFARDSTGGDAAATPAPRDVAAGWRSDRYRGLSRLAAFGTPTGMRNAFLRLPEARVSIIILTDRDAVDARALAERIADRLLQ
jgi:hypothetical protein